MNGKGHYALGATAGVVWCQVGGLNWWQALVAVPLAAGASYAAVSPDIDQSWLWRKADRLLPDEWLGANGPMQHRGISHWFGIPAVLSWLLWSAPGWWWTFAAGAVLAGWWSHLVADAAVGRAGQGRGPGIPLAPWWGHVGLGAKCGGWLEKFWATAVPVVTLGWMGWHAVPDTHVIVARLGL